jgi:hypothetical protein
VQRNHVLFGFALVAVIALVGTAVAGPDLGGGSGVEKAASGGNAKKAAKKKKAKPGPRGPAGPAGAQGAPGASGAQGPSGLPPAHAQIIATSGNPTNSVHEPTSSGVTDANVVRQGAGLYCVYGLPFTPRHAQISMSVVNSQANAEPYIDVTTNQFGESGNCPNTPTVEQAVVFVDGNHDPVGSFAGVDVPVYVAFYP